MLISSAIHQRGGESAYLCRDPSPCSPLVLLQQAAQLVPELDESLASRKAQSHGIHLLHQTNTNSPLTLWLTLENKKRNKQTKTKVNVPVQLINQKPWAHCAASSHPSRFRPNISVYHRRNLRNHHFSNNLTRLFSAQGLPARQRHYITAMRDVSVFGVPPGFAKLNLGLKTIPMPQSTPAASQRNSLSCGIMQPSFPNCVNAVNKGRQM